MTRVVDCVESCQCDGVLTILGGVNVMGGGLTALRGVSVMGVVDVLRASRSC